MYRVVSHQSALFRSILALICLVPRVCLPLICCSGPRAQWTSCTLPSAAKLVQVSAGTGTTYTQPTSIWVHVSAVIWYASCVHSVVGRKPPERLSRQQLALFFDRLTGTICVPVCVCCVLCVHCTGWVCTSMSLLVSVSSAHVQVVCACGHVILTCVDFVAHISTYDQNL